MAKSKAITFRLPSDEFPMFRKNAVEKGLSDTEYAEHLVLLSLKAKDNDPILDHVENLLKPIDERLRRLETNARLGLFTVLVECGTCDPAEVEEFLNQQWK